MALSSCCLCHTYIVCNSLRAERYSLWSCWASELGSYKPCSKSFNHEILTQNRTWAVTIYRQVVLPSLDFMNMPYSGTLTTILSSMEPAIAIVLACVPLMRPIFEIFGSKVDNELRGVYANQTGGSREHSGNITEPFEDDDNDSQIQLQPVDVAKAGIATILHDMESSATPHYSRAITVKKSWAVELE